MRNQYKSTTTGKKSKFYTQSEPYTCGPSCVMMLRRFLGEDVPFTMEEEFSIWEKTKTNNESLAYTTHPRLASFLMSNGYKTELWHNLRQGFVHTPIMKYWEFYKRMKY